MTDAPAICLSHVSKRYPVQERREATVLSRLANYQSQWTRSPEARSIVALDDVSLTVKRGEIYGIVGRNAAGKTTLLKIMAGILPPDTGSVTVQGRVVPLLNLGSGLVRRLTVRDNIQILCVLYGLDRATIQDVFASIVQFAELEDYVDMYPRQLSRGLVQRLLFSIAIHTKPDIWLLDEVFAAGDVVFRAKATERMQELIQDGRTIVIVSHETRRLEQFCHHVTWLEHGHIVQSGDPHEVTQAYLAAHTHGIAQKSAVPA